MNILARDIHTEKDNYTRFLVLEREAVRNKSANKVTLSFCTSHKRGSLASVLTLLAEAGLNLTKLQSFPISGKPFQYRFHTDMEFSAPGDWDKILTQLTSMVSEIEVYGLYKSATFQLK